MAKKTKKSNKANKPKGKKITVRANGGALSDPRVRAWDQLLRDPCSANLAPPCYAGMDSGYLIRTVDVRALGIGGLSNPAAGNIVTADFFFQYSPFNVSDSTGVVQQGGAAGASLAAAGAVGFPSNFVTSALVKRYRPVACCLKWLPSGPYNSRQGTVSLGYSPGQVVQAGDGIGIANLRALAQRYATNGAEMHEVRWLPTAVDENFTTTDAAINTGAGAVFLVLQGVDATTTSTTAATLNGTVEITTVWEWVPSVAEALSVAPKAPLPYTSQQVLGTIGDLGAYIFHGVRSGVAAATQGMMMGASGAVASILSRGVQGYGTRGPSMRIAY